MKRMRGTVRLAVICVLFAAACSAGPAPAPAPVPTALRPSPTPAVPTPTPSSQVGGVVTEPLEVGSRLGPWLLENHTSQVDPLASEGVATVGNRVLYRGPASIPLRLRKSGWVHIGDPDGYDGYVLDAYQGSSSAHSKLYEMTTPAGRSIDFTHELDPGELLNNSFVAISPDGQWTVSGEWEEMHRLLVFPTPLVNPATAPTGGKLAVAADLTLDHAVRDVQGCDFVTAVQLVCATDDPQTDLWSTARQILLVDLPRPLDGRAMTGHVSLVGPVLLRSACTGTFETEGVDVGPAGDLLLDVIPPAPCDVVTTVYRYRRQPAA